MSSKLSQWTKLSPWSVVSFTFNNFRLLLTNAYAILPFVYTGWNQGFDSPWMIAATSAILLLILVASIVKWLKFRYRLQDQQLDILSGLLFTKADKIPFNKIQNVRMQQPFYFRPVGLYSLVVETAGSKHDEASLAAIPYRHAIRLKKQLLAASQQAHTSLNSDAAQNIASSEHTISTANTAQGLASSTLVSKSFTDLIKFGFYQNNFLWFAIIAGPIFSQLPWEDILEIQAVNDGLDWYLAITQGNIGLQAIVVILAILLSYMLFSMISIVSAILKYFPYKLSLQQDTLHRTGGVLAKQHDAMRLKRIQVVRFSQPIFGRIFKLWTIDFKQVKGHEVEKRGQHMLVPSMSSHDIANLLPQLEQLTIQAHALPPQRQGIHPLWFWRRLSWLILAATIISAASVQWLGIPELAPIIMLVVGIMIAVNYLTYRQWGFHKSDNDLWIHKGTFARAWHCLPLSKVQHVNLMQTPSQRKRGLATLYIGLASGTLELPYIELSQARAIAEHALSLVTSDNRNWI